MVRLGLVALACSACSFREGKLDDGGVPPPPDGSVPSCADRLEPNDVEDMPTIVKLEDQPVRLEALSLCPLEDRDVFFIPLEGGNGALEVIAERTRGTLELSLFDLDGEPIASGESGPVRTTLCADLPMGIYFAVIEKGDADYDLTIQRVSACSP